MIYEFRVNDNVNLLKDLLARDFEKLKLLKREAINEAIAFINAIIKYRYDDKYTFIKFKVGDRAYLSLYYNYKILE